MSRMVKAFLVVFMMVLVAGSAYAQDAGKSNVRVIHGTFTSETGETVDFKVPEGRALILKNKAQNLSYRLVPQIVDNDQVVFRVVERARGREEARQEVERFELSLGDAPRQGILVPFALAFTGISSKNTVDRPGRTAEAAAVGGGSCCVQCGGWEVCCEPSAGWCCSISSSCGSSCNVCNAET